MNLKDRAFLNRADKVSENYQNRLAKLIDRIDDLTNKVSNNIFEAALTYKRKIELIQQFMEIESKHEEHKVRVERLRNQQQNTKRINKICQDANRLAGVEGANFFQKCSKILQEESDS